MSDAPKAVFLSYAREDSAAARRVAEALRSAGLEVWFDESELRGGDDWDAKIKRQIRECGLFIAIISATTQKRGEGYFRREWKLAVERSHDMSESRAFLLPVLIDDKIAEASADVPQQFFRVHFTRLPGALPTPDFIAHIKRLFDEPKVDSRSSRPSAPPGASGNSPRSNRAPALIGAGVVVAGLAIGAVLWFRPAPPTAAVSAPPVQPSSSPLAPSPFAETRLAAEKSIAVLPFVNMSSDKEQEFFSDGISEELLNLLAKIPELQVAARTSAFSFKGKNVNMEEIGRELHVANVLEGSVRKSGNTVRITAQLIRAADGYHLWSNSWDRALDDIFKVQDEIAGAVVGQLKVTLLGAPKAKTVDPKAYALFLEGRTLNRINTADGLEKAVNLYKEALAIDPNYAAAWRSLGVTYLNQAGIGSRPGEESFRLARAAVEKALAIDPNYATAYSTLSTIVRDYDHDVPASARYMERALALDSTDLNILGNASNLLNRIGRLDQGIPIGEYIAARDPLNAVALGNLGGAYVASGRFDQAIEIFNRVTRISSRSVGTWEGIGEALLGKGEKENALAAMKKETDEATRLYGLVLAQYALGHQTESDAALAEFIAKFGPDQLSSIAGLLAFRGEVDRAFEWFDKAVQSRDTNLTLLVSDPVSTNAHQDPRWLPLLRKIGLAPEQLAAVKLTVKLPSPESTLTGGTR